MRKLFCVVIMLLCVCSVPSFGLVSYTGSLTVEGGGLEGTGFWITNIDEEEEWFPASLSWTVSENGDGTWDYTYNLDVYRADVSHFIVEASPSFGIGNLSDPSFALDEIKTHVGSPGQEVLPNPFLPEDIYGPKFEIGDPDAAESEYTSITVSFTSDRDPIWGDFYAKCGKTGGATGTQNTVWNQGLTIDDPLVAPDNGTVLNHVLVPDTIPEPATMGLLGLGALLLRRKK